MEQQEIKDVLVYGQSKCVQCDSAKALLDSKGIPYTYVEVGPSNLEEFYKKTMGARSIPQVLINGQYVGNYVALRKALGE